MNGISAPVRLAVIVLVSIVMLHSLKAAGFALLERLAPTTVVNVCIVLVLNLLDREFRDREK